MEIFLIASLIGMFVLLAVHLLDYAPESQQQPIGNPADVQLRDDMSTPKASKPAGTVLRYDRAA